jgi:hypothetical protein
MIEEKIEEMRARTKKLMDEGTLEDHLPEQMEFFGRETLPLSRISLTVSALNSSVNFLCLLFGVCFTGE